MASDCYSGRGSSGLAIARARLSRARNSSARLDRFGSNAPQVANTARDGATQLSRVASELLAAADGLA